MHPAFRMMTVRKTARDKIVIVLFTLAAFAPFVGKAFHIDDPIYLYTARQIIEDEGF